MPHQSYYNRSSARLLKNRLLIKVAMGIIGLISSHGPKNSSSGASWEDLTSISVSLLYLSKEFLRRSFPKLRRPESVSSLANSWVNRSPVVQKDQLKATRWEKERLLLSGSASCHLLPVIPNLSCRAIEAQPKLRDGKKEPEAATGGRVSVPMPRTARCATPPGSRKAMLETNQAISHERKKNVQKAERSTNLSGAVVMEDTCPRRVMKDKPSTVQNTDTLSTAWYLRLLKPARLTAISSAGGKAL